MKRALLLSLVFLTLLSAELLAERARRNPTYHSAQNTLSWTAESGVQSYQVVIRELPSGLRVWGPYYHYATVMELNKISTFVSAGKKYRLEVAAPGQQSEPLEFEVPTKLDTHLMATMDSDGANVSLGYVYFRIRNIEAYLPGLVTLSYANLRVPISGLSDITMNCLLKLERAGGKTMELAGNIIRLNPKTFQVNGISNWMNACYLR